MRVPFWLIACLFTVPAAICPAQADDYPNGPIKIVVPWAPGSTGDVVTRFLSQAIEPKINQRMLLENRPGAGGNIGTAFVSRARPDGYTLVIGPNNVFAVNQFIYANIGFDPVTELTPITKIIDSIYVLYIGKNVDAKSVEDLVKLSRDKKLFFGSSGTGTSGQIGALLFKQLTGANVEIVSYASSALAVTALLRNEIQGYVASSAVGVSQVAAGNLRALVVANDKRISAYPDTPSAVEVGYPQFLVSNWWGMAAPKGTPAPIAERMYQLVREALDSPAVKKQIDTLGSQPAGNTPTDFKKEIESEAAYWKVFVAKENIRVD